MKPHAVGIDLGTTYSVVAHLDETGRTQVIRNTEGEMLTPSVVLYDDSEVIVGKEAKKATAVKPDAVAEFVKRDMGKRYYSRLIHGEQLHPEVIQACILKKLKDDAVAVLGSNFEVVVTVPAYFDEPRRKATADAGEMAGLRVLDIVNEPTAAALAFGESLGYLTAEGNTREPLKILVYDLGGGTFDVTLLDLRPGDFRTLVTDGDVQLGGHDWDMRLVNYAAEQFQSRFHLDPRESPASLASLLANVEEAKHTLTARSKTNLTVRHGGHSVELPITRELFEELTEDLLERTSYTTRQVLGAAGLTWQQVNRVLLVGGSTRMPMVSRMIERLTGLTPDRNVNPDEAVARGAAIFAGYCLHRREAGSSGTPHFKVTDVNSHSLGIEGIDQRTMRKENVPIIPRNTPLPAKVSKKCVTKTEDQLSIVVKVLEGESRNPKQCSIIGKAVMRNLPEHLPKGWPVEVTYEYLTNGRLEVHAHLPGTSKKVDLELQRDEGLTAESIGRWKTVLAEAKGFDAFEGMLEEVVHASRSEREAALKGPPRLSEAVKRIPEVDEQRNLSAAEKAFAQIDSELTAPARATPQTAQAVAPKPPAPRANPNPMRVANDAAKPQPVAKPIAPKVPAPAPTDLKTAAEAATANFDQTQATRARRESKRLSPTVMAFLTGASLLLVSVLTLLLFYYMVAWATKLGDFLHLGLPLLPPPKIKPQGAVQFFPYLRAYVDSILNH